MRCVNEVDFTNHPEVSAILRRPLSAGNMLEAALLARKLENSAFVRLPAVFAWDAAAYPVSLECLELAADYQVIFTVEGLIGRLIREQEMSGIARNLIKNPQLILDTLSALVDEIGEYAAKVCRRGVKLVSYADPSANVELWGERSFKKVIAPCETGLLRLFASIQGDTLVHVCPLLSEPLAQYSFISAKAVPAEGVGFVGSLEVLAQKHQAKLSGHQCINAKEAEKGLVYQLQPGIL
jgi:hypothetical protein